MILASESDIRKRLLQAAGVPFVVVKARLDEESARAALDADGVLPGDMALALAELKARKVSLKNPAQLVIGCDQILEFEGRAIGKARNIDEARSVLQAMRGKTHHLYAASIICENGREVWRGRTKAAVTFRKFSDVFLENYLLRRGHEILGSVGCYQIEEEGIRLVAQLKGDLYAVYGLPILELLQYLTDRKAIEG